MTDRRQAARKTLEWAAIAWLHLPLVLFIILRCHSQETPYLRQISQPPWSDFSWQMAATLTPIVAAWIATRRRSAAFALIYSLLFSLTFFFVVIDFFAEAASSAPWAILLLALAAAVTLWLLARNWRRGWRWIVFYVATTICACTTIHLQQPLECSLPAALVLNALFLPPLLLWAWAQTHAWPPVCATLRGPRTVLLVVSEAVLIYILATAGSLALTVYKHGHLCKTGGCLAVDHGDGAPQEMTARVLWTNRAAGIEHRCGGVALARVTQRWQATRWPFVLLLGGAYGQGVEYYISGRQTNNPLLTWAPIIHSDASYSKPLARAQIDLLRRDGKLQDARIYGVAREEMEDEPRADCGCLPSRPLANLPVTLWSDKGRSVATTRTNAEGVYSFSHIETDHYVVQFGDKPPMQPFDYQHADERPDMRRAPLYSENDARWVNYSQTPQK